MSRIITITEVDPITVTSLSITSSSGIQFPNHASRADTSAYAHSPIILGTTIVNHLIVWITIPVIVTVRNELNSSKI